MVTINATATNTSTQLSLLAVHKTKDKTLFKKKSHIRINLIHNTPHDSRDLGMRRNAIGIKGKKKFQIKQPISHGKNSHSKTLQH